MHIYKKRFVSKYTKNFCKSITTKNQQKWAYRMLFFKSGCAVEGQCGYESQLYYLQAKRPHLCNSHFPSSDRDDKNPDLMVVVGKIKSVTPWRGLSAVPGLTCAFQNQLGLKDLVPFSSLNSASETSPPGFVVSPSLAQHLVSSPHIWIVIIFLVLSPLSWVSI